MTADTIAAIATPPGSGALAVVRLSGPLARDVAARLLGRGPEALPPRRALTARVRDEAGPLDRVVCVFYPAGSSPTGEDCAELTCHGSLYIQRRLLGAACAAGARPARPGEFTQRGFLNGRLDLAQAEAVCDLIGAQTALAHRAALEQLEGTLSRELAGLRRPLVKLLARVEAGLDHPDEDIPEAPASVLPPLAAQARRLAESFSAGRLLREGARICLAGRPNAGKSTLFNALLGRDRAIVCPEPGTTRDAIAEPWDLGGLPAVLIDTAGLGHEGGAADAESQRRALRALESCDLVLRVIDSSRGPEDLAPELARAIASRRVLTVLNKADLAPGARPAPGLRVSALTGRGLPELKAALIGMLAPETERDSAAAVTSRRHHLALARCAAALESARRGFGLGPELAARDLRDALEALDEITGPAAPGEVLDEIFSKFCVGK
ncbi:MAG: tRNA uridine-5-carboxymethylaminomethyl(34) synthesis GTPase MnmE [Elusimicrobia bacterium]|nr:tRNA uridine-5-carboxymethylaminomethyl(34) synthesis GTPase MnmE [Elusimicrobiota bacterium]